MTQILIKFAQGMGQVIHGVNKYNKLALYNLPLSLQILAINFLIAFIGFVFLIFFNFFLIKNDDGIAKKRENANQNLKGIQSFLEKNSIIRVPLFNDNCTVENLDTCNNENNFELSDPVLEPKITQEYILNNYLNSDFIIKVYNEDWIRLVDTLDLYDLSSVQEADLEEGDLEKNNLNFIDNFSQKYLNLFLNYYDYLVKSEFSDQISKEKSEIFYVSESIKERASKEYIIQDRDGNIYQYFTSPILSNNKVYGVIILNYPISSQATNLGYVSLNTES